MEAHHVYVNVRQIVNHYVNAFFIFFYLNQSPNHMEAGLKLFLNRKIIYIEFKQRKQMLSRSGFSNVRICCVTVFYIIVKNCIKKGATLMKARLPTNLYDIMLCNITTTFYEFVTK